MADEEKNKKMVYEKIVDLEFGKRVRKEREKMGYSIKDIVELCGYSYARVVGLELGRVTLRKKTVSYQFLERFAELTHKSVDYYIYGDDKRQLELFLERYFEPFLDYFGEYEKAMLLNDFRQNDFYNCSLSELMEITKSNLLLKMG